MHGDGAKAVGGAWPDAELAKGPRAPGEGGAVLGECDIVRVAAGHVAKAVRQLPDGGECGAVEAVTQSLRGRARGEGSASALCARPRGGGCLSPPSPPHALRTSWPRSLYPLL